MPCSRLAGLKCVTLCCSLWQALEGKYVEPGPGGDPIRNPAVLPTGKNIHALDPQSIPTQAALKSARVVVERCALLCHVRLLESAFTCGCSILMMTKA